MNQADRDRKKTWKAEQKTSARNAFPLSSEMLTSLFDFVDVSVGKNGCDPSRRFTEKWLDSNRISPEPVMNWLEANGGFCDCEVAGNALELWEENR